MINTLISFIVIENDKAVMHDAAGGDECYRDIGELHLKIRLIRSMQLMAEIITEDCYVDSVLYILK